MMFLDVDGVVNAVSGTPDPQVWPDWQTATVRNRLAAFPILWSPSVVDRLCSWDERGLVEIFWLTTWLDDANGELAQTLGLPGWAVLGSDLAADPALSSSGGAWGWWKADLVHQQLHTHPGRPFVWLDDDLDAERALCDQLTADHDCLLLAPSSPVGLTPAQLDEVESWLQERAR